MTDDSVAVELIGDVLYIRMQPASGGHAQGKHDHVTALGDAVGAASADRSIRTIVLTGAEDGEFLVTPPSSHYAAGEHEKRITDPARALNMTPRIVRTFRNILNAPQPVIARVNGDAIGFGQSVLFAADMVVAWEDSIVSDIHLGLGAVKSRTGVAVGPPFAVAPGDGAAAFVPSFMAPAIAKEYFMFSRSLTGRELADRHIINYAVAPDELDAKVDQLCEEVRMRPPHLINWTKHFMNLEMKQRVETVLAATNAIEALDFQVQRFQ